VFKKEEGKNGEMCSIYIGAKREGPHTAIGKASFIPLAKGGGGRVDVPVHLDHILEKSNRLLVLSSERFGCL